MKKIEYQILIVLCTNLCCNGYMQGFVNLDFESANLSGYSAGPVPTSEAIPGWTVGGFLGPNEMLYNTITIGSPNVTIVSSASVFPSPIDGIFGVFLQGGDAPMPSAFVTQTGLIPVSAKSLLFKAQADGMAPINSLVASLGGQNASFSVISTGPSYTLYGSDISTFAGLTEQLTFSVLEHYQWNLDDIQFSPSSVPEPSVFGLFALGALSVGLRRWRNP
jgi:PEP-CTERM motif